MELWTDGSHWYQHPIKPGGWACVVLVRDEVVRELQGHAVDTTTNRMELRAVVEGLIWAAEQGEDEATVYTDSMYVVLGFRRLSFMTQMGTSPDLLRHIKNGDMWREADDVRRLVVPRLRHVRGHTGLEHNERADRLAHGQMRGILAARGWDGRTPPTRPRRRCNRLQPG